MNDKKYVIKIEGNRVNAIPFVQLFMETLGAENVEVEYMDFHFGNSTIPAHWFKVTCNEIKEKKQ